MFNRPRHMPLYASFCRAKRLYFLQVYTVKFMRGQAETERPDNSFARRAGFCREKIEKQ